MLLIFLSTLVYLTSLSKWIGFKGLSDTQKESSIIIKKEENYQRSPVITTAMFSLLIFVLKNQDKSDYS